MTQVELAVSYFKKGFSCSQALLLTYGSRLGLDRDTALKVSSAFGGGMGSMGKTCGAVTGAFMVIGLKYGRTKVEDTDSKEKTYYLVKEFVNRFKSRNGSIKCKEILGYDISTPKGIKLVKEKKLFVTHCSRYVQDAAEIIEQILWRWTLNISLFEVLFVHTKVLLSNQIYRETKNP